MADVDPDDGPFVSPPVVLIIGLSNVIISVLVISNCPIVIAAFRFRLRDDVDLHLRVVAAFHSVASHLCFRVTYYGLCFFCRFELLTLNLLPPHQENYLKIQNLNRLSTV